MNEWDTFWAVYPRKVGKLAAEKAYRKARARATQEELMAGLHSYIQHKPAYADWCHPQTWLNSGRWLDEWAEPQRRGCGHSPPCRTHTEHVEAILAEQRANLAEWFKECREMHEPMCQSSAQHEQRKREA